MTTKQKHGAEPFRAMRSIFVNYTNWNVCAADPAGGWTQALTEQQAKRLVDCASALAGIPDPAAALEKARKALEHAHALALFARDASVIPNQTKRHQADADQFAEALRLLTPEKEERT